MNEIKEAIAYAERQIRGCEEEIAQTHDWAHREMAYPYRREQLAQKFAYEQMLAKLQSILAKEEKGE